MRKKYFVKLSEEERAYLEKLVSSGTAPARKLTRARILLKSDCGAKGPDWTYRAICEALDVNSLTVTKVRQQFMKGGLAAALERKQPERQYERRLDGEAEAHLIALACSQAPQGRQRWTLRLLAEKVVELGIVESLSYETVRSVLKKTSLSLG
jgi:transposase-like protein